MPEPALGLAALRGLQAESAVLADLERLKVDAAHRASVREILWTRAEEYIRWGYRRRPWLKALEIPSQLDKTHPLDQSKEDELIALFASYFLERITTTLAEIPVVGRTANRYGGCSARKEAGSPRATYDRRLN
jgi:hypothetical protein